MVCASGQAQPHTYATPSPTTSPHQLSTHQPQPSTSDTSSRLYESISTALARHPIHPALHSEPPHPILPALVQPWYNPRHTGTSYPALNTLSTVHTHTYHPDPYSNPTHEHRTLPTHPYRSHSYPALQSSEFICAKRHAPALHTLSTVNTRTYA